MSREHEIRNYKTVADPREYAGGGGGGFTPFTEGFADLAAWTTAGTIAAVGGRLQIAATTAAAHATDYDMTEAEGSYDLVVDCFYSGSHEHQIGFLMDATLAAKSDYYRSTTDGNGYVVRITSSSIELCSIVNSQTSLKTWTITGWTSGDTIGVRLAFAANGDLTVSALRNGSVVAGGTHVIAAASLVAGRGTKLGLCGFANAGNTTEFDNLSYDVTAA